MLRTDTLRVLTATRISSPAIRGLASFKTTRPSDSPSEDDKTLQKAAEVAEKESKPKMTQAQKDQELMQKLAGISGEGGEAGIEYENGKAVAMKRGVKNNMFRLI